MFWDQDQQIWSHWRCGSNSSGGKKSILRETFKRRESSKKVIKVKKCWFCAVCQCHQTNSKKCDKLTKRRSSELSEYPWRYFNSDREKYERRSIIIYQDDRAMGVRKGESLMEIGRMPIQIRLPKENKSNW